MALTPGTRLGAYEVTEQIGAGGMGEVYRATDSNLKRSVAIKVLPASLAGDTDRLARFQREAEVLAALNHPNIAAIYGLERSSDMTALVMELVEGEDLSQRIARGPIPLDEALPIAKQIAEALEAAHEQGIIHRDLKPANIKVRADGTVKVLDFGLAKAIDPIAGSNPSAMNSPTLSIHATQAGIILGTAAYMSPEQARGQAVDRRADIWAFGCVLFEILTGKAAFKGENVTDIISSVVRDTPDWNALPQTPIAIRRLLQRCLEKDPRRRVAHMSIARLEIDEATMSTAPFLGGGADAAPASRARRGVLIASACVVAALAIGWATARYSSSPTPGAPAVQFPLLPPEQTEFNRRGFATFAVSPDGRYVAYVAMNGKGLMSLWLHSFGDGAARELPNTTAATNPFWSPDGHFIAFHADRKLQRLEIASGTTQLICECAPNGGTWNRDNVILFSATTSLQRVAAAGGTPEILVTINSAENEVRFQRPNFLPDGRHFVFTVMRADNATPVLRFGELGSAESKVLGNIVSTPEFVEPGFLVYGDNGRLMARSFDAMSGTWTGDPVVISNRVRQAPLGEAVAFSTSSGGTLVYDPSSLTAEADLVWVDRDGREGGTFANVNGFHTFALAPNDQVAAVELLVSGRSAIWLLDGARGTRTRLTFEPTPAQGHPMWSPDMSQILYFSGTPGARTTLTLKAVANTGQPVALLSSSTNNTQQPTDWSADGRYVLFDETDPKTSSDVRYVALGGDKKPITFVGTPFQEHLGRLSPDGKYLAYTSNDSGRPEVFVVTFPDATRRWSVSSNGGTAPTWRHDGNELFFVDDRDVLMAVAVTRAPEFQPGVPKPLFPLRAAPSDGLNYAVARDGRVLVARPSNRATVGPLQVVMHLPQLLGSRD